MSARLFRRAIWRTGASNAVVIIDALATDKGEFSKLISVARAVPELMIEIDRSGAQGRAASLACLADGLKDARRAERAAEQASKDPDLIKADTDTSVSASIFRGRELKRPDLHRPLQVEERRRTRRVRRSRDSNKSINFAFDSDVEPKFADFVASQLDELYNAFLSRGNARD